MNNILTILQLIISLALIIVILVQSQGAGLGNIFGGGGGGETYRSKRGAEKVLLLVTIALAVGFLLISMLNLFAR